MGVYPKMDGFYHGKSENQLDENWGYPYMTKQKPPYNYIYMEFPALSDTRIAQRTENLFEAFDLSCASISLSLSVLILYIQLCDYIYRLSKLTTTPQTQLFDVIFHNYHLNPILDEPMCPH